jgi:adenylate cyclase
MAVFGMSSRHKAPEQSAVLASFEILQLLEARYRGEDKHIDVGIGINSGPVVAGYVSTKERVELTVLGDTVNVAARLEGMARPNRIFIGPKTQAALKSKFTIEDRGEKAIKGRTQPLHVHEIIPQ